MSEKIVQLNEEVIKGQIKEKVSPSTISELNKKACVHIENRRNRPLQGKAGPSARSKTPLWIRFCFLASPPIFPASQSALIRRICGYFPMRRAESENSGTASASFHFVSPRF